MLSAGNKTVSKSEEVKFQRRFQLLRVTELVGSRGRDLKLCLCGKRTTTSHFTVDSRGKRMD